MAELLIGSIQILTNRGSGVDAGDRILCYWDDVAEDVVVKHYDVSLASTSTITSGPDLGINSVLNQTNKDHKYILNLSVVSILGVPGYGKSNSTFCSGTTLNYFILLLSNPSFPYVVQNQTLNAASCVAQVCDIKYVSPPSITHATTNTGNDGAITVLAETANGTVKYGLTDFVYSTGGQTSGTFNGLSPGEYTVYAKDQYNCSTAVTVTVELEDAYEDLFEIEYDDNFNGRTSKFIVYERGYVGDLTILDCSGSEPVVIQKIPKDDDKLNVIEFTKAVLSVTNTVDFQFLRLFTQDDRKFKGVWQVNGSTVWTGYLVPSVFTEPYKAPPYQTTFEFIDGLKDLERIEFRNEDGSLLYGEDKIIKLISFLLKKTGIELNIRVAANIYETDHATTAADDPLDQTYVDYACYRNDKNEPFDCLKVLESVLKPFGARIFQWNNRWNVVRIEEEVASYDYREYDSDGVYSSNGTFNPILSIGTELTYANRDHVFDVIPSYGVMTVKNILNKVGTLVTGSFEQDDLLIYTDDTSGFKDWSLQLADEYTAMAFHRAVTSGQSVGAFLLGDSVVQVRNSYIKSKSVLLEYNPGDKLRLSFEYGVDRISTNIPFIVLRFKIKLGSNYLQQDGTWDTTEYIYRAYPPPHTKLEKFEATFSLPDVSVTTEESLTVSLYPYFSRYPGESLPGTLSLFGDDLGDLRDFVTVGIDMYRTDVKTSDANGDYIDYYDLQLGTDTESVPTVIRPDDYNAGTNKKVWKLVYRRTVGSTFDIGTDSQENVIFIVDKFDIDVLPNGEEPAEEELLTFENDTKLYENLEVELFNADLPEYPQSNAERNYNNYFRHSDGEPTLLWTRDGYAESLRLQRIYLKTLQSQFSNFSFRLNGSFVRDDGDIIGLNNTIRITRTGDAATLSNTTFTTDLSSWTNEGTGTSFAWSADNSNSAQATLTGSGTNSKKLTQAFATTVSTNIDLTINLQRVSAGDDREDRLIIVYYNGSSIIQSDHIYTFLPQIGNQTYSISETVYCASLITKIGFFVQNVEGTGTATYNFTEFAAVGSNSVENYKIANFALNDSRNIYTLELQLISASADALGSGTVEGREHSSAYSTAYS